MFASKSDQFESVANATFRRTVVISALFLIANLFFVVHSFGQTNTWDGSSSTNWNTAANWSLNLVPTAAHDVVIPNSVPGANDDPVINTAAVCSSFTISGGNFTRTITISGTNSLTVTNGITIESPGPVVGTRNITLDVGAGSLSCASITMEATGVGIWTPEVRLSTGTVTVTGDITMEDGNSDFVFTGAGNLNIGGNMTGGTFTASTGTVNYNGGSQTIGDYSYYNLTLSGSGVKTTADVLDINGAITLGFGTSFTAGSNTHTVAGDWTNNGATFISAGSTITLDGTAQTIGGTSATTFNNLTLAGSGTKTFGLATTIDAALSINTGVVADLGAITMHTANALALGGVGQAAGTWGSTASAATNQTDTYFTAASIGIMTTAVMGPTTYYSRQTGNWNVNATWSTVTYGNATNTGTFPVAGDIVNIGGGSFTINVNVASACGSISFKGGASSSPTVSINSGIALDVSDAITIPRAAFGDDNILAVGAGTLNAGSLAFTDGGGDQRHQLTISTGTATISGDITAIGSTGSATITFTGAGLLQLGGAFLNSSNCTFTPSTGTVEYNGSVPQTMGDFTYNNLTLSGSGVKTAGGALDVDGTMTLSSGTSFTADSYTHTVAGNWINNGATFTNNGSTITLDGAAQTIGGSSATTFSNLTLAGSNTKSFGLSTTIDATLAINAGVVANLGSITTHTATGLALNGTGQAPGTWGSTASAATNQNDTYFTAAATGIVTITGRIYYLTSSGDWDDAGTWSTVTYDNGTNTGTFPVAGDIANIGSNTGPDKTITVDATSTCSFLNFLTNAGRSSTVTINTGIALNVSGSILIPRASGGEDNILAVGAGTLNAGSLSFTDGGGDQRHQLTISTGTATISGDVTAIGSTGSATITFTGAGLLQLGGAFLNSSNCTFTPSTGTVEYNGSVAQTITDLTYYSLKMNNTYGTVPQLTLSTSTTVTNTLDMTSGILDLNNSTLTLGASGSASTLSRTASTTTNWMYGGVFSRFWPSATAITSTSGNYYGLFPVGTVNASSYRPVAINSTVSPTGTGSFSVTHTDASTVTDLSPVYDDGGTDIERKHDAQFNTATTGTGGTYDLGITMTDIGPGTLSDVRLALSNGTTTVTTVGTHSAATGAFPDPVANRTGVSLANLVGDWRITTTNSINTPLPIELVYFKAEVIENIVQLTWETASEQDNDFFTIEHSPDGVDFYELAQIPGSGTTSSVNTYSYEDGYPFYGLSYYRLKQTDFDGKFEYSNIIAVQVLWEGDPDEIDFEMYPNPTSNGKFMINSSSHFLNNEKFQVVVRDYLGRMIASQVFLTENHSKFSIDLDLGIAAKPGIYIVTINIQDTRVYKKLIVE